VTSIIGATQKRLFKPAGDAEDDTALELMISSLGGDQQAHSGFGYAPRLATFDQFVRHKGHIQIGLSYGA